MTDQPPLTDEELAAIEAEYPKPCSFGDKADPQQAPCGWTVHRLIADLRASRAEVAELRRIASEATVKYGKLLLRDVYIRKALAPKESDG